MFQYNLYNNSQNSSFSLLYIAFSTKYPLLTGFAGNSSYFTPQYVGVDNYFYNKQLQTSYATKNTMFQTLAIEPNPMFPLLPNMGTYQLTSETGQITI